MKSRSILWCLLVLAPISLVSRLQAQVPGIINYQGRVSVNGTNFNGTGQFQFALVNGPPGTTTYWSNGAATVSVPVTKGLYSVLLGDTTVANMATISATVFTNADVRLRVWFSGGAGLQQLTPDQRLAAVGYALMAASVPAGSITAAQLASNAVTAASIASGAVTTAAIANGAVGANQLATNALTAALAANGVLTNVPPQYWASNQYYLACSFITTNGPDLVKLWLWMSADGTNFTWLPVCNGFDKAIVSVEVNDPTMWTTNGTMFYTFTPQADYPTNVLTIWSASGLDQASPLGTIDCSSVMATGTMGYIFAPQIDATPGAMVSNLFVMISTNAHSPVAPYITTCTNLPNYSLWTTPTRINILGGPVIPNHAAAFTYHGTNMLLFTDGISMWLATNTTSAGGDYAVWKQHDWGGWISNGILNTIAAPFPLFMQDRIRIYADVNYATFGDFPSGVRFHYSDCFDDWKTWTPMMPANIVPTNVVMRGVTVLPVVTGNDLQSTIATRLGLPQAASASTFTVQGVGTIGGALVANGPILDFGGIRFAGAVLVTNNTSIVTSNTVTVLDSSAGSFTVALPFLSGSLNMFILTNANPNPVTISAGSGKFADAVTSTRILSNQNEVLLTVVLGGIGPGAKRYLAWDSRADAVNFGSAAARTSTVSFVYGIANNAPSAPTATVNNAALVITNSLGGGFVFYQSTEDGAVVSNTITVVNATSNSVLSFVSDKNDGSSINGVPTDGSANAGYPIPPGGYVKILAIAADKWVIIGSSGHVFVSPNKRFWYQTVNNSGTSTVTQQP